MTTSVVISASSEDGGNCSKVNSKPGFRSTCLGTDGKSITFGSVGDRLTQVDIVSAERERNRARKAGTYDADHDFTIDVRTCSGCEDIGLLYPVRAREPSRVLRVLRMSERGARADAGT